MNKAAVLELHRKIRSEGHKIYLNLLASKIEPFSFDYYDVAKERFFKQGEFWGNHYRYHIVFLDELRPDEPIPWRENVATNGNIPVYKFNAEDCDFGKAPETTNAQ